MPRRLPVVVLLIFAVLFGLSLRAEESPTLDAAIALFDAKRVPEAREQLAVIVAREPKNVTALWYLGQSELKMQRREDAANTLAKAVKLAPQDHRILAGYANACLLHATELGVSLRAIGYARRGRNALEQAVKLAPENVGYREGLVQFYIRAPRFAGGDFDRAYVHIAEIAKYDPARAAVIRANTLCAQERYDEAAAACEDFLRDHPDDYLALYTLGRIASETGIKLAPAETSLLRCLQLTSRPEEPAHAEIHYRLGLIAEKSRRPADARREYQSAVALEPAFSQATEALDRLKE